MTGDRNLQWVDQVIDELKAVLELLERKKDEARDDKRS